MRHHGSKSSTSITPNGLPEHFDNTVHVSGAISQPNHIDGLSIGYRTKRAEKDTQGRRLLHDLELWEVSLVTFPMLPEARVGQKAEELSGDWRSLASALRAARVALGDPILADTDFEKE